MGAPPTFGVEEEFLLVDPESREPRLRASEVLGRAGDHPSQGAGAAFHAELLGTQVEAATGVCTGWSGLRGQLREGRERLAEAARAEGLLLVSAGTPVLAGPASALTSGGDAPGERFERIRRLYEGVVADYQACGCHVHVGVPDREAAVAVVNHLRPWLPTLLALSANSPFDHGRDSGYASWRMVEQSRFPGSGVPPRFTSAADHDRQVDRLVECGVLVDRSMTFWLARPSPHLPTVEVRAADAVATLTEAALQAALTRALVDVALAESAAGREAPEVDAQVCAAAVWSAARYGMDGPAVHPFDGRRVPARALLDELITVARPALEKAGDLNDVSAALARLDREGGGAHRQRLAARAGLPAVVDMLARRTTEDR
ncbi:YbdK family carboxylate-amine ligase [Actinomadura rudentiformis]|uniref:Putative glutamate--cysteine ligase 2 n=1 Tax=Actinomadura rudentiformis TaxID=359158 RepID=A0A6H9YZI8_9ACTN|nr:YbdK family carboxylate-amine ligase [Actinomadura rudentiformis]